MDALVVTPGRRGSARIESICAPVPAAREVLVRTLEVGVCGTDVEIAAGLFGVAPHGRCDLVLGHELLGAVVRDGGGFVTGDLVAATVRRSCTRCSACTAGSPDACLTGEYRERGITALDGFACELAAEDAAALVPIPRELGRLGVLAEPASVTAKAIRHARTIGGRQAWQPAQAIVLGAGAVGLLATAFLRLDGHEVWTVSREHGRSHKADLVAAFGARYVSTTDAAPSDVAADAGGFDIALEATGSAEVMAMTPALLRRNGVACLLGIDPGAGPVEIDSRTLGVELVLGNRAVFGSVNAHRSDWDDAVARLAAVSARWPDASASLVGLRVPPERFAEAFSFRDGKATLCFA